MVIAMLRWLNLACWALAVRYSAITSTNPLSILAVTYRLRYSPPLNLSPFHLKLPRFPCLTRINKFADKKFSMFHRAGKIPKNMLSAYQSACKKITTEQIEGRACFTNHSYYALRRGDVFVLCLVR